MDGPAIGIDLGTTYSCVAVFHEGRPVVISNPQGHTTTPSYVAFDDGTWLVGEEAKDNAAIAPENTFFAIKRVLGRRFNEPEVSLNQTRWPFKLVELNGFTAVQTTDESGERNVISAEAISGHVLTSMKMTAEKFLGVKVTQAVITVPANFGDSQKKATERAAKAAGLNVLSLINEPTAAAVAYGLEDRTSSNEEKKTILVFDFGGGTLDVSIIETTGRHLFNVLATAGNTKFGGEDFDERILQKLVEDFERKYGPGLGADGAAKAMLRNAAEKAKISLSSNDSTKVIVRTLFNGQNLNTILTRTDFEKECSDLFDKILDPVRKALEIAQIKKRDITNVVMVGGSSKISKVTSVMQDYFTKQPIYRDINADEAIAMGAAAFAHTLLMENAKVGSALCIYDIIPHSLGIRVANNTLSVILPRREHIPTQKKQYYTTVKDNQEQVDFKVFQGEYLADAYNSQNRYWATVTIPNIEKAPAGGPRFTVTFSCDKLGLLHVRAVEDRTGREVELDVSYI